MEFWKKYNVDPIYIHTSGHAYANELIERLRQVFEENNVKKLTTDDYTITYIAPSVTKSLDKSKLFKDYPNINESDYIKTSDRKSCLKIILNKI